MTLSMETPKKTAERMMVNWNNVFSNPLLVRAKEATAAPPPGRANLFVALGPPGVAALAPTEDETSC